MKSKVVSQFPYTSRKLDLLQVVNFTDLMHVCYQGLLKQLTAILWIKSLDNQLARSLLITCSRITVIKPEQPMQTLGTDTSILTDGNFALRGQRVFHFFLIRLQSLLSSTHFLQGLLAVYNEMIIQQKTQKATRPVR